MLLHVSSHQKLNISSRKISGNSIANLKLVASTLFNTGEEGQFGKV